MATINKPDKLIKITEDGLVKVDGITSFRRVIRDGVLYIQFCDYDRMRIKCRGTKFVEIPLSMLIEKINPPSTNLKGLGKADEQRSAG